MWGRPPYDYDEAQLLLGSILEMRRHVDSRCVRAGESSSHTVSTEEMWRAYWPAVIAFPTDIIIGEVGLSPLRYQFCDAA